MASFVLRFSFVSELYGLCFVAVTSYICWIYDKADPGEGKALWISSDGDDRMGVKVKTQKKSIGFPTKPTKIPGPKINPPPSSQEKKNPMPNSRAFWILTTLETLKISSITLCRMTTSYCFESAQNPYLN